MKASFALCVAGALSLYSNAFAQLPPITVTLGGLDEKGFIAPEYSFCAPAQKGHTQDGGNLNPEISWSDTPPTTRSYAVIAVDTEVPTDFTNAGKEGKTIPESMPRQDFYHWVLVNIPVAVTHIAKGAESDGFSKKGKSEQNSPYGLRGINDYAPFMATTPERKGVYAGYDGPCPPWNDERIHKYHFRVYALDVDTLPLTGAFTGKEAEAAIQQHTLATGEIVGLYTLNPSVK